MRRRPKGERATAGFPTEFACHPSSNSATVHLTDPEVENRGYQDASTETDQATRHHRASSQDREVGSLSPSRELYVKIAVGSGADDQVRARSIALNGYSCQLDNPCFGQWPAPTCTEWCHAGPKKPVYHCLGNQRPTNSSTAELSRGARVGGAEIRVGFGRNGSCSRGNFTLTS